MIERKLIQDEIKNIEHDEKVKLNASVGKQYQISNVVKQEMLRSERQRQQEERRILDEEI